MSALPTNDGTIIAATGVRMRIETTRDLAVAVRERRTALGLSQTDVAHRVGATRQWLSRLEAGKVRSEIGLILRTLEVLELRMDVTANDERGTGMAGSTVDLDELLRDLKGDRAP